MKKKKSICFVGLDAYPVLNPDCGDHYFGGESVQHTLLAKAFVELGYNVTLISLDYGQPDVEIIDGITIIKTFREGDGIPVLRFFYPKGYSILKALKLADADIYFQSCAGMLTGLVAWYCKSNNKKFIFRLAHDSDCIPGQQIIPNIRDQKIYEYGLKNVDLISAQGINQVRLMKENYGYETMPINMTVGLPDGSESKKDIDVLWVNNLREFKRPDLAVELAKLLPDVNICMIGGPVAGSEALYEKIKIAANDISNLNFVGAVSYHNVNSYFQRAKIFVNTSDVEGFPNSFLQAWIRGVAVISFFDPDGLISSKGLGVSPENIKEMALDVEKILDDLDARKEVGERCRTFAEKYYSPVEVAKIYEAALR